MKEKQYLACWHCFWTSPGSPTSQRLCVKHPCDGAGECIGLVALCCFDCPLGLDDCAVDRCRQARVMHRAGLEARPLTEGELERLLTHKERTERAARTRPAARNTTATRRRAARR